MAATTIEDIITSLENIIADCINPLTVGWGIAEPLYI